MGWVPSDKLRQTVPREPHKAWLSVSSCRCAVRATSVCKSSRGRGLVFPSFKFGEERKRTNHFLSVESCGASCGNLCMLVCVCVYHGVSGDQRTTIGCPLQMSCEDSLSCEACTEMPQPAEPSLQPTKLCFLLTSCSSAPEMCLGTEASSIS